MNGPTQWRKVPGFENYEVTRCGQVRSISFHGKPRIRVLKGIRNRGYLVVKLGHPNLAYGIHQIVAMAWIGLPGLLEVVNHKNGIKTDNRVDNLEYVTNGGNVAHAYESGLLCNTGEKNGNAKLSDADVVIIRSALYSQVSIHSIAKSYGVTPKYIYRIVKGLQRV